MWTANPYCALCGRLVDFPNGFELDHRIALVNGGSDEDDNLQVLCTHPCHEDKTRRDLGQVVKQQIGLDGWPVGGGSRRDGGDPHGHQSTNSFPLIPDKKSLDVGGGLEASGSHRAGHQATSSQPINRNTTDGLEDMGGAGKSNVDHLGYRAPTAA